MKIVCAPDSFKESLSARAAAAAMARGVRRALPRAEVDQCLVADGGEGTVEALVAATGGRIMWASVQGPLGETVEAVWGKLGLAPPEDGPATAVIEMAAASGLPLVPEDRRDPTRTSTFGTGQLIAAALNHGARRLLVGIGGSATNDGGCGMAQALGAVFFDHDGRRIDHPLCGGLLQRIARIDLAGLDPRLQRVRIVVASDVKNPLTGPRGAACVYGPQKGATPEQVQSLDDGLRHLARLWREQLGQDVEQVEGAGAAGGLGGGLMAYLGAELRSGIELVLEAAGFDRRVRGAALCLTGEGKLDGQSLAGKACLGVAQAAKRHGVPTIALVGVVGEEAERTLEAGLAAYHPISEGLPKAEAMRRAAELLEETTARVVGERLGDRRPA